MTDLHDRFAQLDDIETDDLWWEIQLRVREGVERRGYPDPRPSRRLAVAGAAAVIVAILIGSAVLISSLQEDAPPVITQEPGPSSLPASSVPDSPLRSLAEALEWTAITIPTEVPVDCPPIGSQHDRPCLTALGAILQDVTVANDRLVAVGHDGSTGIWEAAVFTSPDGATWQRELGPSSGSGIHEELRAVSAGPDNLVAVGGTDCAAIAGIDIEQVETCPLVWVSKAGEDWERIDLDAVRTTDGIPFASAIVDGVFAPDTSYGIGNYEMNDVIWTGEQFVAVGQAILTSPDGRSWTMASLPSDPLRYDECSPQCSAYGVALIDDLIIAAGKDPTLSASPRGGKATIWASPDGLVWSQIRLDWPAYQAPYRVIAAGDRYVGIGGYGGAVAATSDNPLDWSNTEPAPLPGGLWTGSIASEAVVDGKRIVAVGEQTQVRYLTEGGAARVWVSLDEGSTWELYPPENQSLFGDYYSETTTAAMKAAVIFDDRIIAVGRFNTEAAAWIGTWTD